MYIHRANNETLLDVAQKYDVNPIILMGINEKEQNKMLCEGEEILILVPTRTANVKRGETLTEVCHRFGVPEERIIANNPLLCGRKKIYDGQLLCIKYDTPIYGQAVRNGYMYSACPISTLKERIYYLDILTLCSAVWRNNKLYSLFDDRTAFEFAKAQGKQCFLRIYLTESPSEEELKGLFNSISIILSSVGYDGVTIGGISRVENVENIIKELNESMHSIGKMLYIEISQNDNPQLTLLCDGGVITYEKLNLEGIPSFKEGEEKYYGSICEIARNERCFIELSSFAYGGGKFVEKDKVIEAASRKGCSYLHDDEGLVSKVSIGGRKATEYVFENLANLKAKLELINTFGYMGIAFDLLRVRMSELMMIEATFTSVPPLGKPSTLNCQGEM